MIHPPPDENQMPSIRSHSPCPGGGLPPQAEPVPLPERGLQDLAAQQLEIAAQQQAIACQKLEIDNLTADNLSKQALISELQHVQQYVQMLNQDLAAQNGQLQVLNSELEAFTYAVSHDLRAPLRGICGFAETLERISKEKLQEEEKRCLKHICDAAVRMGQLIDDLLHLSRVTRAEMVSEPINLSAMAREIMEELHEANPSRKMQWTIQSDVTAMGDSHLMRIVMENLFNNALKYTAKREEALISFQRETSSDSPTVFVVRDNGTGFNMKYVDRLFKPFQRLHSVREFPGSGIGLATVARIIHRHGGRIWAVGELERGASFHFTLDINPRADRIQDRSPWPLGTL